MHLQQAFFKSIYWDVALYPVPMADLIYNEKYSRTRKHDRVIVTEFDQITFFAVISKVWYLDFEIYQVKTIHLHLNKCIMR